MGQDWAMSLQWQSAFSRCSCRAGSAPPHHPDTSSAVFAQSCCTNCPLSRKTDEQLTVGEAQKIKVSSRGPVSWCLPEVRMSISGSTWHCCSFLVLPQTGQTCSALCATSWLLACDSVEPRPCLRDFHVLSGRHVQGNPRVVGHCPEALKRKALVKPLDFSVSGPWLHYGEANAKSLN